MSRYRVNKSSSARSFRKNVRRTHRANVVPSRGRGGYRL